MPDPIDDDTTVALKKTAPAVRRSARPPLWMIAIPAAVVMGAMVGAGLHYWSASPSISPSISTSLAPSVTGTAPAPSSSAASPSAEATIALVRPPARFEIAVPPPEPPAPVRPEFLVETGDEARILDNTSAGQTVFRLSGNRGIMVLDFASLRQQGLTLNRIAAFAEKTGGPRDRVLNDAELDAIVRRDGETVETFYYGHDYGLPALVRFFSLADRDRIVLLEEEEALRRLLRQEGWFESNARGGLLSIPQVTADGAVTRASRSIILRHELSHGEYFANPDYAAFVRYFWMSLLTSDEKDRILRYLRSQGYDATIEELMENEAQAYLMFTYSDDFFTPAMIGMRKARLAEIRTAFFKGMPGGWLRDGLGQFLAGSKPKPAAPVRPAAARP